MGRAGLIGGVLIYVFDNGWHVLVWWVFRGRAKVDWLMFTSADYMEDRSAYEVRVVRR